MPASNRTLVVTDGPHAGRLTATSLWRCSRGELRLSCDDGRVAIYEQVARATTLGELWAVLTRRARMVTYDRFTFVGYEGDYPPRDVTHLPQTTLRRMVATDDTWIHRSRRLRRRDLVAA